MTRALVVVCVLSAFLVSCTEKVICPAYQSAYIYDKEALRKKFSYFENDSVPKVRTGGSRKNRYLIAKNVSYKTKTKSLQTVAMKPVQPVVPDSLKPDGLKAEMILADSSLRNVNDGTAVLRIDTLAAAKTDSTYMISLDKEVHVLKYNPIQRKYYVDSIGYNVQQDNYMWYLREILVLPDVRLMKQNEEEAKNASTKEAKKKKGIGGFFRNLFKKKDKSTAQDSTQNLQPVEDYGYDDFEGKPRDSTQVNQPPAPQQKKGFFSFLKRKKKDKPAKKVEPAKKEEEPVKKEEDENDGF
jgi:hypothetical protein